MNKILRIMVASTTLFFMTFSLGAQELDPLLKLLIEKKVLTESEAVSVQKEYDRKKSGEEQKNQEMIEKTVKSTSPMAENLAGLKIGGTYFMSYQNGNSFDAALEDGSRAYNKFVLKRGYFDVRKEISPYLYVRFIPDLTQDSTGEYKLRMKFLYADFHWKGNSYFSEPHFEVGLIHFAWFDMGESINAYRLQDGPYLERIGMATTADLGMLFGANFGVPLPKSYQDEVSKAYPGRWGSFELAVYNGSGFTANEKNTNKVFAGRISLRPIPDHLPGLQFHLFGVSGKGNVADNMRYDQAGVFFGRRIYPKWNLWALMVSYQHPRFTLEGQCFEGDGNFSGTRYYMPSDYVPGLVSENDIFKAYSQKGHAFFGEVKLGDAKRWSLIGRYDYYNPDTKGILVLQDRQDIQKRYIYGVACKLIKNNMVLLDYQKLTHSADYKHDVKIPDENRWQLTLQIKF